MPKYDICEEKHGKWIFETRKVLDTVDDDNVIYRRIKPVYKEVRICSQCGHTFVNTNNIVMTYCPHCASKNDRICYE